MVFDRDIICFSSCHYIFEVFLLLSIESCPCFFLLFVRQFLSAVCTRFFGEYASLNYVSFRKEFFSCLLVGKKEKFHGSKVSNHSLVICFLGFVAFQNLHTSSLGFVKSCLCRRNLCHLSVVMSNLGFIEEYRLLVDKVIDAVSLAHNWLNSLALTEYACVNLLNISFLAFDFLEERIIVNLLVLCESSLLTVNDCRNLRHTSLKRLHLVLSTLFKLLKGKALQILFNARVVAFHVLFLNLADDVLKNLSALALIVLYKVGEERAIKEIRNHVHWADVAFNPSIEVADRSLDVVNIKSIGIGRCLLINIVQTSLSYEFSLCDFFKAVLITFNLNNRLNDSLGCILCQFNLVVEKVVVLYLLSRGVRRKQIVETVHKRTLTASVPTLDNCCVSELNFVVLSSEITEGQFLQINGFHNMNK